MDRLLVSLVFLSVMICGCLHYIPSPCKIQVVSRSWEDVFSRKARTPADLVQGGYINYSIRRLSSFRLSRTKIIIPPSLFDEFRKLPDKVLSASAAFEETLHVSLTLGLQSHTTPVFVQQYLNSAQSVTHHVPVMSEEILQAQERLLAVTESKSLGNGDNEGWVSIEILPTTQKIISQVICRLFVGKNLSRDTVFTQKVADFSYTTIICSIVLDWCPSFLRPSIARVLPIKKYKGAISNALRTDILTCLDQSRSKRELAGGKGRADNGHLPLLQVLVDTTKPMQNPHATYETEAIISDVADRFLAVTFGAIDPTTVAFSQVVLDLISQPQGMYLDPLRQELRSVLALHGNIRSFAAVKDLKLMDSFIRESQRLRPIAVTLAARKVVCKGGWTFKNGDHAPEGSMVSVPTYAVHRDETWYQNSEEFDGFRFLQTKKSRVGVTPENRDGALKSDGDAFLAFGYGRHACSGRLFGLTIIKLLLAHLLMGYELESLPTRPPDKTLGNYLVPDLKTVVRVRKIKEE